MTRRGYSSPRSAPGQSPALTFLASAYDAMPATLNEGDRVDCMSRAMKIAIECRFQFDKQDAEVLKTLEIDTSAGVFRPLHQNFYTMACTSGGTYPRLWEAAHAIKPWIAEEVLAPRLHGRPEVFRDNRVAPGLGILIPVPIDQDELTLARLDGKQVWLCTSMTNDDIVLCRYRLSEDRGSPYESSGNPVKKWKVGREEWAALRAKTAVSAADAPDSHARSSARVALP